MNPTSINIDKNYGSPSYGDQNLDPRLDLEEDVKMAPSSNHNHHS